MEGSSVSVRSMNIDFEGRRHILNLKREFYKISNLGHII